MAKKKDSRENMAVCGGCMELIDVNQIMPLIRRGLQVTHDCGKNLGKYEASTKS